MVEYNGQNAYEVIDDLRKQQWNEYEYEEFLHVLKTRIRRFTGRDDIMFLSEDDIVKIYLEIEKDGKENE